MNEPLGFMPHGMCFLWQPNVLTLHVASDSLVALSYFCIPILLLTFARHRPALQKFGWFFSAFILSCGLTHVMDVWTIWHPDYWISGGLKAITAIASLGTVAALLPLMPYGRALSRMSDLDRLNAELETYRLIVESSNDGVWLTDSAGRTTLINAQLTRMLGFTLSEIVGEPLTAFIHAETGAAQRARFARDEPHIRLDGIEPLEVCLRRKDGSPLWAEVQVAPIFDADGLRIGAIATVRDTTQRRRDRLAIAESELRYRTLAEAMPHAVFTADPDGVTDYCNRALLDYTGLSQDAAYGDVWTSSVHPQDLPRSVAVWTRALERGEPAETQHRIRRASDGMYRWFVVRATPVYAQTGAIVKWIGSAADIHDYKLAAQTRDVLDTMGHIIAIRNDAGFEYLSPSFGLYTGMATTDAASPEWRTFIHAADLEVLDRQIRRIRECEIASGECELRLRSRDGSFRWFLARTAALTDADGTAHRVNIWTDIDDLKRAQIAFGASETRYHALTDSLPLIVWIVDHEVNVTYVNQSWSTYTGRTCQLGKPAITASLIHPEDLVQYAEGYAAVKAGRSFECEGRLLRHDGTYRWHLIRTQPIILAPSETQSIVTATDIEARKSAEEALARSVAELTHRAHHDPLTSMPNRTKLMDQLAQMIAQAQRDGNNVVVLYLDVDHFKAVNDTLGHAGGDQLLLTISARINNSLRAADVAGRLGGDEFVLAFATGSVEAAAIAQRLQLAVRAPIEINGTRVVVGSSIGISVYPTDGETATDLVQRADAAMYAAKKSGRDAWCFYNAQTALPPAPALELELELREAIAREEFVVYYQPIFNIESGEPIGAEALVRWAHPERGLIMPGEFIAFAEDHGMVAQIGEFVLNTACAQLRSLNLRADRDFSIAVNVSAHQFVKPGFVGTIVAAIAASGIDPWRLEIEITESVVAEGAAVIETLDQLEELGVRLSIDDFGTGYSSLAYLKHFPIHTLKIDRSFIIDLATNFTDQAIAKTIVTLARSLGMRTIAEGVETADQLEHLRWLDADCAQGYLFSRPLSASDFETFLATTTLHAERL